MNWYRKLLILCLALALTVGASCTSGELPLATEIEGDGPTADGGSVPPGDGGDMPPEEIPPEDVPPEDVPPEDVPPGDSGSVPPADSGGLPAKTRLLICLQQDYAVTTAVIGPQGGQINVGSHSLTIYENALSADVTITAEQIEGTVNSVRFSPEGLQFAVPAELTLDYQNCAAVPGSKRVVYTDESLNILESPPSVDVSGNSEVKSEIDHFSRYAIAY